MSKIVARPEPTPDAMHLHHAPNEVHYECDLCGTRRSAKRLAACVSLSCVGCGLRTDHSPIGMRQDGVVYDWERGELWRVGLARAKRIRFLRSVYGSFGIDVQFAQLGSNECGNAHYEINRVRDADNRMHWTLRIADTVTQLGELHALEGALGRIVDSKYDFDIDPHPRCGWTIFSRSGDLVGAA